MRQTFRAIRRQSERGSVAVEAAIVLSFLAIFVTLPSMLWAFYFYQYSAAQKAVHDAALYLSTAPKYEMTTVGPEGDPVAMTVARRIFANEMAGLNPPAVEFGCYYRQGAGVIGKPCTTKNNQESTLLHADVTLDMPYLNPYTGSYAYIDIEASAAMPYTGN